MAKRDAATLLPIIAQHVQPGKFFYSDEWAACHQLATTTGTVHLTVNHSLHFVDPLTDAHTHAGSIEGMWSACKRMMFDTYLPEYMWRRKFSSPLLEHLVIL